MNRYERLNEERKIIEKRKRVAAYCRVSTDDEDQIKSYNSMVKYYTELIKNNNQWIFAGVYAFLTIQVEDISILKFIRYACAYFLVEQQSFEWRYRGMVADE